MPRSTRRTPIVAAFLNDDPQNPTLWYASREPNAIESVLLRREARNTIKDREASRWMRHVLVELPPLPAVPNTG